MTLAIFNIGRTLVQSEEPSPVLLNKQLELILPKLIPAILSDHNLLTRLEASFSR